MTTLSRYPSWTGADGEGARRGKQRISRGDGGYGMVLRLELTSITECAGAAGQEPSAVVAMPLLQPVIMAQLAIPMVSRGAINTPEQ